MKALSECATIKKGSVTKFLTIKLDEVFSINYYETINNFCNSLHVEKQESSLRLLFWVLVQK